MIARRNILAAGMAAAAGGCVFQPSWELRYRLRIRVVAGGQMYEGSNVYRTIYTRGNPAFAGVSPTTFSVRAWGEAMPIDMGAHGYLFALMGTVVGGSIAFSPNDQFLVIGENASVGHEEFASGALYERAAQVKGEREIDIRRRPHLVRFDDLNDLNSVRFVPIPGSNYRYFGPVPVQHVTDAYGEGARIASITLEVVRDQVTRGIERILPWVNDLPGARPGRSWEQPGARPFGYTPTFAETLVHGNFKRKPS